jgi:protoporphyrin/coproporphyrin ferrochelatase
MTGVLLVNMGGPESLEEMKVFLSNMFRDPFILPFNKPLRHLLSFVISSTRYKKSWKKYELIGGTPIISGTHKTVLSLQAKLRDKYKVRMAFSYSSPFIEESLLAFKNEGINDIVVIPLYPQASLTTTSSVIADVEKVTSREKELNIKFVKEFYRHDGFVRFWSEIISAHILDKKYTKPFLLFSAHSIPKYLVDKGDTYPIGIEQSAKMIAQNIGIECDYAYQSGMSRGEWLTPDTKVRLKELAGLGIKEIIIIPISFVNENLETLYDVDNEIIPYAKNELGIESISRVRIPEANELFIQLLSDLVKQHS